MIIGVGTAILLAIPLVVREFALQRERRELRASLQQLAAEVDALRSQFQQLAKGIAAVRTGSRRRVAGCNGTRNHHAANTGQTGPVPGETGEFSDTDEIEELLGKIEVPGGSAIVASDHTKVH